MPTLPLYDENGDTIQVPAMWEICDYCSGDGYSSAYLGSFSSDDLNELGDEWCEDYARGLFDRPCDECHGAGKVLVADESRMTPEQAKAWKDECDYRADLRAEQRMRERGIQF